VQAEVVNAETEGFEVEEFHGGSSAIKPNPVI